MEFLKVSLFLLGVLAGFIQHTGSAFTKAPATVATMISVTQAPSNSHTTFPYSLSGCQYKGKVYHKNDTWDDGCDYRCTCIDDRTGKYTCRDICPTYINLPKDCSMIRVPGECCAHPDCHGVHIHHTNSTSTNSSSFTSINECYYKGKTYKQDETWRDGCEFKCTCVDANKGFYRCTSLCYTWNIPAKCYMNPPAPGKCCETPNCPAGYDINYPKGYVVN